MQFPKEFLSEVCARNDIAKVFQKHVRELKPAGHDFVCCCPFHSEKTPSCHIYEDHFYCFGCGAGGDVITFVQRIENRDFADAVQVLAEQSGLSLPNETAEEHAAYTDRAKLLGMNKEAARYFRDKLMSEQGTGGLFYLTERGLTLNTIRKYGLGYAPGDGSLISHLKTLGYNEKDLIDGSLAVWRDNKLREKFWSRVMFPIIDRNGAIVGFGGRIMNNGEPKYLNSGETAVFRKREQLFSLNFAKNDKNGRLILCEGYMDVIAVNQAGFGGAVATLGTAITEEQARIMARFAPEVVIAYDADGAGQKAATKAINLLGAAGVNAKVLQMKGAKDPDEYIKKFGAEAFGELINKSGSAISYEIDKLKSAADMNSPSERAEYLKKAVRLLADINDTLTAKTYAAR
ncbi:MAG: DNA primase, partial [Oscillospiraceae bacterium]|nr:DNA primase [Oscillospiraceae bacterium]